MDDNHTCTHFSDQIAEGSSVAYYSYLFMECVALAVINIAATIATQYMLRRFDLFRDELAVSFLRLSLILPIALITGHMNLFTFTRCSMTHLHKAVTNLIFGSDAMESASFESQGNISHSPEL
jgi:hypothetical protein